TAFSIAGLDGVVGEQRSRISRSCHRVLDLIGSASVEALLAFKLGKDLRQPFGAGVRAFGRVKAIVNRIEVFAIQRLEEGLGDRHSLQSIKEVLRYAHGGRSFVAVI